MKIIKKISIFLTIFFSFNYLHAMKMIEDSTLEQLEENVSRKPLLPLNQLVDVEEEQEDRHNYFCSSFSLLDSLVPCWNIIYRCRKAFSINSTSIENERANILMLSPEVIFTIADFLSSLDILKLSGVCKKFHQIFNESYWVFYLSKKPRAYSYLMLNGNLSPSRQRKSFFSHLWYMENRIGLAARLGHPEAVVLQKYGLYGAYIGNDQYICPSGVIKYVSGKIDYARTGYYRDAQRKKIEADLERREKLMVGRGSISWKVKHLGW